MGLTPEMAARLDAMEEKEHEFEEKLDAVANNLALKYGYDSVPWFALTWWVLWIYTILTLLVMFLRPDFLNLTICIIGLYMMFNTDRITKNKFRMLVFGVALSIVYDLVWFFMKHQEYAPDVGATETTSGVEAGIKKFSLMMAYTSFFFRVRLNHYDNIDIVLCNDRSMERQPRFLKDHSKPHRVTSTY